MNSRNAVIGAGGLFCAAGVVLAVAGGAQAAPNGPGNNGTIKVHELGTPAHTVNNDPHVCQFNFEYFFQDSKQPGYDVVVEPQGGNGGPSHLTLTMPKADATGYSESVYVNADPSGETDGYALANGHYKVTVMGKDGTDKDEKAKSKVFWVKCNTTPPTTTPPVTTPPVTTPPPTTTPPVTTPPVTTPPPTTTPPVTTPPVTTPPVTTPPVTTPPATTPPATTTSTAPPPAVTTTPPSSGPLVVTDGPSGGNGSNTGLIGGGIAAAGLALAGAGYLRRRMTR